MSLLNHAAEELTERDVDAPTKLKQLIELQFEFLRRNRSVALLLAREPQRLGPKSRERWRNKRQEYRRLLQEVIEQGMRDGDFRQVDAAFASLALIGLMTLTFLEGLGGEPTEMAMRSLDIFLNGIHANPVDKSKEM